MKAITVGGAMVDSIALIADERIERMSMSNAQSSFLLLEEGRKIEAQEISRHIGGGAVNAAVAMARLGLDAATLLKIGQDERADMILRRLADEGVSTRWVMRDARLATGAAVMISSHARDAAIFTFRGANTLLAPDDLAPDMFGVDLVYISSLSNESADCFPHIVRLAKAAGAKIATNPGIRQLTSRSGPFQETLCEIDILTLNRVEANALVPQLVALSDDQPVAKLAHDAAQDCELLRRDLSSGGHDMALPVFMQRLRACGVGHVLITNGSDGAYLASGDTLYHCPVVPAAVAGTAGAGDAFAATFASLMVRDDDPVRALQAAALNAASVIGHADTQTGLLTRDAIEARLVDHDPMPAVTTWSLVP
ncbi:MAG: carbohydrate kinase family protein [Pseudomonadota bacterium]